jgi:basic amino acid/polyamine antiporter, APA family
MEAGQPPRTLARKIGLGTAVAVVVGSTIGSGIFRTPAGIAELLPGPLPMLLCWTVAGLLVLCGALTLAEVGGGRPETGGMYAFLRDGFGRLPAFLFGWSQLVLIRPAALAAVAMVFAEYFLRLFGPGAVQSDWTPALVGAGAIVAVTLINFVGVLVGGSVQNATTILKVLGLLAVVAMAFAVGLPQTGGHYAPFTPEGSLSLTPFGLALISVLWAYDGWADGTYVAGEIQDPRRNVPRSILLGTLLIIVVYLLANFAYLAVLSTGQIAASPLVAADVAQAVMGRWGEVFVIATVMVSTFGTLNGSMLTSPRIFFAMAEDRLFFRPVARISERFGTPSVSTWLTCGLGVAFILVSRRFENLADLFVTAMIPFYALAVATVFSLRRQEGYDPPVRTPLYPLPPLLFILAMALILANPLYEEAKGMLDQGIAAGPKGTYGVLATILAGVPIYYLTVGRKRPNEN